MPQRRKRTPSAWRVECQLIRYVYEFPDITRQELAVRLGQSPAAISLVIRRLINAKWLRESGRAVSLGGRRPVQLRLSSDRALIVGQSITSEGLRSIVINPDGEIVSQVASRQPPTEKSLASDIVSGIREAVKQANIKQDQIIGAGIAISGQIHGETGIGRFVAGLSPNEPWYLTDLLQKEFDNKVIVLDHVTRSRLVWEVYNNTQLRDQTILMLDFDSEVGAALSSYGVPYRASDGAPIDIGSIMVSANGRGGQAMRPLAEAVSVRTILAKARRELEMTPTSPLADIVERDSKRLSASSIYRASQAGDAYCYRLVNDVSEAVGQAVAKLCSILRPTAVLITGQLVTSGLINLDVLRRIVRLSVEPAVFDNLRIVISETEDWAPACGIAHIVLRKWLETLGQPMNGIED